MNVHEVTRRQFITGILASVFGMRSPYVPLLAPAAESPDRATEQVTTVYCSVPTFTYDGIRRTFHYEPETEFVCHNGVVVDAASNGIPEFTMS